MDRIGVDDLGNPERRSVGELESGAIAHLSVSFAADDRSSSPWTYTIKVIGTAYKRGMIMLNPVLATELPEIRSKQRGHFTAAQVGMLVTAAKQNFATRAHIGRHGRNARSSRLERH